MAYCEKMNAEIFERVCAAVMAHASSTETMTDCAVIDGAIKKRARKTSYAVIDASIAWMRGRAIRDGVRMIREISNTRVVLTGCPFTLEKSEYGEIIFTGKLATNPFYERFNRLVELLVAGATKGYFDALKRELQAELERKLDIGSNQVAAALSDLVVEQPGLFRGKSLGPRSRVPQSLRLLNNLPVKGECLALAKRMWEAEFLDKEVYRMAVRLFGPKFCLAQYNWVARHHQALEARKRENASLLRLLLLEPLDKHSPPIKQLIPQWADPFDSRLRYKSEAENFAPIYPETMLDAGDRAYQEAKALLKTWGLTDAGWRWLAQQGPSFLMHLKLSSHRCRWISEMAMRQLGKLPRMYHLNQVLDDLYIFTEANVNRLYLYLKAVVSKEIPANSKDEWTLLADYANRAHPTPNFKNTTWASVWRKQERWHRDIMQADLAMQLAKVKHYQWEPLVGDVSEGAYSAHELTTTGALIEEGCAMRHCVGGYTKDCRSGRSTIFSIRKDGQRVSTIELRRHNKKLEIRQNFGAGNTRVAAPVQRFGKLVLAHATKAMKARESKAAKAKTAH